MTPKKKSLLPSFVSLSKTIMVNKKSLMKPLFPPFENQDDPTLSPSEQEKKNEPLRTPASLLEANFSSWGLIQESLKKELPEKDYTNLVENLSVYSESPDKLELTAKTDLFFEKAQKDLSPLITTCKDSLGLECLTLEILPPFFASPPAEEADKKEKKIPKGKNSNVFSKKLSRFSKLNPKYTFETFVRGPSNQFALAACQSVAENPGVNYNPLFLYGSTGLGKTHLLHAVGNYVQKRNKDKIVTYISSEQFMNEMIYCIRHNKMWDFRQKYRHCDVFMVDDIQFISGNKSATQEEFFHTFNTLHESKKQIIVTSDLFPQEIPDIEERLKNRFQWGLVADIQPPDVEHRIAILMSKAEKLGVRLLPDVADYIATHAKRNIRELEGALHRIVAFAALQGRPIDKHLAFETFQGILSAAPKKPEVSLVQKAVAEYFKIKPSELRSKTRKRTVTIPRQIAMYLARTVTNSSYPDLGVQFGGKDHTTILHAVKRIAKQQESDPELRAHIDSIKQNLDQLC